MAKVINQALKDKLIELGLEESHVEVLQNTHGVSEEKHMKHINNAHLIEMGLTTVVIGEVLEAFAYLQQAPVVVEKPADAPDSGMKVMADAIANLANVNASALAKPGEMQFPQLIDIFDPTDLTHLERMTFLAGHSNVFVFVDGQLDREKSKACYRYVIEVQKHDLVSFGPDGVVENLQALLQKSMPADPFTAEPLVPGDTSYQGLSSDQMTFIAWLVITNQISSTATISDKNSLISALASGNLGLWSQPFSRFKHAVSKNDSAVADARQRLIYKTGEKKKSVVADVIPPGCNLRQPRDFVAPVEKTDAQLEEEARLWFIEYAAEQGGITGETRGDRTISGVLQCLSGEVRGNFISNDAIVLVPRSFECRGDASGKMFTAPKSNFNISCRGTNTLRIIPRTYRQIKEMVEKM